MKTHKYGMRMRPIGIGCQPVGHTAYQDSTKRETGYHGILTYKRQLSASELTSYELDYLESK